MGAEEVLKRKSGVIYGEDVYNLFKYAQKHQFAIPAINVTSSSTVVAALEAARDMNSPIILQMSNGGAAFFAGKGINNKDQNASVQGAIAGAHYIKSIAPFYEIPVILHTDHCAKNLLPWLEKMLDYDEEYEKEHKEPLFSSHMIDFSEEDLKENIEATKKILLRAKAIGQFLEMEVGITGGEEDGKDNEGADKASMSTTKEQIWEIYEALSKISRNFTIAAAFGNVHGVYPKGNVKLTPEILKVHRDYVKEMAKEKFAKHETAKEKLAKHEMAMDKTAKDEIAKDVMTEKEMANYNLEDDKPVFLVFHGGSGSELHKFQEAISYGVVKVNLDTDMQFAYLEGIRDYILKKKDYLMTQIGNPDGEHEPNKSYYDPRKWVREGEVTMKKRVEKALTDFKLETKDQVQEADKPSA